MTPETSRAMNAQVEKDRHAAWATGRGLRVHIYDCGGYSTSGTYALTPGTVTEHHVVCISHEHHSGTSAGTTGPDLPSQAVILLDLARICSRSQAEEIAAGYYLIPRHELPEVPAGAITSNCATVGNYTFSGAHDKDPARIRRDVASLAAWADYLEQHQAAEERATKAAAERLQARRDELARQIASEAEKDPDCKVNYAGLPSTTKVAVDRIINLEDQQP